MTEPQSKLAFEARFHENERIEGYGSDTTMIVPCPFCAAPDFMRWKILQMEETLSAGATCAECGRSCKGIFEHRRDSVHFEMVQTGGSEPAEWIPRMRRINDPA